MDQIVSKPRNKNTPTPTNGRDEMNLAEFPFASLRRRGDKRDVIEHEGWVVDKDGNRQVQKWTVRGLMGIGLPTEFDERVYVSLMAITAGYDFEARKVPFSVYRVLKIMGEDTNKKHYELIENSLDRLKGTTIKAEGSFWDNSRREFVKTVMAFNLLDKYWLRYREKDDIIREEEGVPGYIVWGEDIWNSFKSDYIKNLDVAFFYGLQSPTARRLYRFLDKRMQYQQKYEIDIFELASRLGMVRYSKPAWVKRKLQPAFDELISKGFLTSCEVVKHKRYTRVRFVKASKSLPQQEKSEEDPYELERGQDTQKAKFLDEISNRYGTTQKEIDLWEQVLGEIRGSTTRATFVEWFSRTTLLSLNDNTALIGVPDQATREWLTDRLSPIVRRALETVAGGSIEPFFEVLESPQGVLEQ